MTRRAFVASWRHDESHPKTIETTGHIVQFEWEGWAAISKENPTYIIWSLRELKEGDGDGVWLVHYNDSAFVTIKMPWMPFDASIDSDSLIKYCIVRTLRSFKVLDEIVLFYPSGRIIYPPGIIPTLKAKYSDETVLQMLDQIAEKALPGQEK